MPKKKEETNFWKKGEEVLKLAEKEGISANFFFESTFKRYLVQLQIMEDLQKEIAESGATVKKEYVKGRANVYTNPAITEFNKTATAANNTVGTLLNIVKSFEKDEETSDELTDFLREK